MKVEINSHSISAQVARVILLTGILLSASCDRSIKQPSQGQQEMNSPNYLGDSPLPAKDTIFVARDFNPDVLAEDARHDPTAARKLHGLYMLCEGLVKRATSPAWRDYKRICDQSVAARSQLLNATTGQPSPDWLTLAALSELSDDDDARKEGLKELLRNSQDVELRVSAAAAYVTPSYLRDLAEGSVPPSLHSYPVGLQIDVSLIYGCQIGLDCSPSALATLGECAVTQPCQPGASLQQVVEIRRSPQEMNLIRLAVTDLIGMSGS